MHPLRQSHQGKRGMKTIIFLSFFMAGCVKRVIIPVNEHSFNLAKIETLRQEKESAELSLYLVEAEREAMGHELYFTTKELRRCRRLQNPQAQKKTGTGKK